jgi:hypothetical protein
METVRDDCKELKGDVKLLISTTNTIAHSISSAKVWAMVLYIGLAGALLFVMAKGFGWLK